MNRRQLLHTLSVLTAGSAWAAFSRASCAMDISISLPLTEESLPAALIRSKAICELILRNNASMSSERSSCPADRLNELTALIDQANFRVAEQCHHSPAFWQACADAFLRAAKRLGEIHSADQRTCAVCRQAEFTFRQTAQLLEFETARTVRLSHTGTDVTHDGNSQKRKTTVLHERASRTSRTGVRIT